MTIVIVTIVALPLASLVARYIQSAFLSQDYTAALYLAQYEIELVDNLDFANITTASFPNYQSYDYDVTRTVSYASGNDSSVEALKQITVQVTKSGSATVLVSLVTYVAKNVTYGV
ncbi:MAG: hypothetical protein KAJ18_03090 [Candidatus Omnitrophica bacterium]|nr:hypothetical protein [Candidatus Omnitrophota bacterium]